MHSNLAALESIFVSSQGCYTSVQKNDIFLYCAEKPLYGLEIWAQ